MNNGRIVKILSDDYFISKDKEIYVCKARGKLKNDKINLKVGDYVLFNKDEKYVYELIARRNYLDRPNVANIDQVLIITSLKKPDFDSNLLDKLLAIFENKNIKAIICFTKKDLLSNIELKKLKKVVNYYQKIGYKVVYNTNIRKIKKILKHKTTVLTGQTGSGKSTLLNKLDPNFNFKTNEISKALGRGKHTTTEVTLVSTSSSNIIDTPGFSSVDLNIDKKEIKNCFIEFKKYSCPYTDCLHSNEQDCQIKKMVSQDKILKSRYENYLNFLERG